MSCGRFESDDLLEGNPRYQKVWLLCFYLTSLCQLQCSALVAELPAPQQLWLAGKGSMHVRRLCGMPCGCS